MRSLEHDGQAVREELERILSSPGFARNERLCRFLRFLVERHLEGRDEEIKESLIAVEVFGRKPDYAPRQDSIVRTEAGRLRGRLTEYYAAEGSRQRGIIEVPKGGYVPLFREVAAKRQARTSHSRQRMRLAVACAAVADDDARCATRGDVLELSRTGFTPRRSPAKRISYEDRFARLAVAAERGAG